MAECFSKIRFQEQKTKASFTFHVTVSKALEMHKIFQRIYFANTLTYFLPRYYQSNKSSGLSSNLQPTGAKADHLREEMEEAANRMEICRVSEYYLKCQ